jgi:hypothetical protein
VIRTDGWWNIEGWPLPEEWAALWGFLTLMVTIVAATVALLQFGSYIREREERARPYLQADFEFRSILLDIVVKNMSGSPATNVSITADPPIESTLVDRTAVLSHVTSSAYRISQLAPGRDIRWFLDRAPDYYDDKTKPRQYTVTLSYDDPRATRPRRRWQFWRAKLQGHYVEAFTLDIQQWGEASAEQDYDNQNWNINTRNEQVLKEISGSLRSIAARLASHPSLPSPKRTLGSATTVAPRRASPPAPRKPSKPENSEKG